MCLIIARKTDGKVDWQSADRASKINRDGYGIFFNDRFPRRNVQVRKSMRWSEIRTIGKALEQKNHPFVIHMRYMTNGAVNISNTHPFKLEDLDLVMAHNGIINTLDVPEGMSDTRVLACHLNDVLPTDWLDKPEEVEYVTELAGTSRLTFMDNAGRIYFINEDLGAWQDNVWYSQPRAIKSKASADIYNPRKWTEQDEAKSYDPQQWLSNYNARRASKHNG
tara:strand:- start:217 stop:882 length:666 start_codon:yes stop_codon:yes gene_type:complete